MDFDHLAEQQSNLIFQVWLQNLLGNLPEELAGKVAARHRPGTPVKAARLANGAFNICYRVTYDDGHYVLVRFTALGRVVARNEKVEDEVAIMQYVAQHTAIPIPKVLGCGRCAVGPYIVMDFMKGKPLSGYLSRGPPRLRDRENQQWFLVTTTAAIPCHGAVAGDRTVLELPCFSP